MENVADVFQQLDNHGVRDVDPKQRSLNIIGQRHKIVELDSLVTNTNIPDITDISQMEFRRNK